MAPAVIAVPAKLGVGASQRRRGSGAIRIDEPSAPAGSGGNAGPCNAIRTPYSSHECAEGRVRLHLFTMAYTLDKFLRRRLHRPSSISHGSSRTSQANSIKVYAKEIPHARDTCFRMAKV